MAERPFSSDIVPVFGCGVRKRWPSRRFHDCFEAVVDRQPEADAVLSGTAILTYRDIEVRANALARALIAHGVTREQPVGVLTERSGMLPLALLAILKAGGAYVPLGADLPVDRLVSMARQSKMRLVIALGGLELPVGLLNALEQNAVAGEDVAVLRPEDIGPKEIALNGGRLKTLGQPTDLAAILFTSGSTGHPKGVQLQHDAVLNMAYGHIEAQKITPQDRVLLATAPGFILGFRELCVTLLAGAALVPVPRAVLDEPAELLELMSRHRVSVAHFTPSYLRLFNGVVPAGLRCLITAGEPPNAEDSRAYASKVEVWNFHGATEVCGTICMMRVAPDGRGRIPSGRPFVNTSVHLLDAEGQDVCRGEIGEIYVVGLGIARGYLNQPTLTAASFVQTRHGRAYRTRDLGRWTAEGYLIALGRTGDVVKVSGQSVSLGEIEQTLLRHPDVGHAVVVQHEGRLIAFVKASSPLKRIEDWHAYLGKTLPSYMLPAQVAELAAMPTNTSGKVDRHALLALAKTLQASRTEQGRKAPQGEVEKHIAVAWEEALGICPILREDNYFALGGTSLLAIAISQRLLALGYTVPARTILTAPTIAALAEKIAQSPVVEHEPFLGERAEGAATKGQEDFWVSAALGLATTDAQITRILAVKGNCPPLERWQAAWTQIVARHAALRTAFFAAPDDAILWRTLASDDLPRNAGFSVDDYHDVGEAQRSIALRAAAPFSLTAAPLARAGLARLADGEMLFWFTLHHAVADGLSARILQEEMHALLLGHSLPEGLNGTAIASQAEQEYLASPLAERDGHYWRDKLDGLASKSGETAFSELPTDHSRPSYPSGKSAVRLVERLDAPAVATLTRLAQAQQVGLYALLLTLLAGEARRRSGRSIVVIGSSVSVRPAWAEAAAGYFVNLPPLVLRGNETNSLAADIHTTQAIVAEALEHAAYPSGLLYREFRQRHPHARSHGRTSLFDISLTANPSRTCGNAVTDFSLAPCCLPGEDVAPAAGIDLAFSHEPLEDGGQELALVWNPDVYRLETAQAWLRSLIAWARWLAEDTSRIEAPVPALLPEEIDSLAAWEHGPCIPRPAKRIHELFEANADQHPGKVAVVTESGEQSISALERQANRIAQLLIRHGVSHLQPVAVLTECTASLPAAVLGIWKAGGVYLPLSVEQPPERLAFIAKDANAKLLLALDGLAVADALSQAVSTVLRPENDLNGISDERPRRPGNPQDPAYIIYTSGTTGTPKGVALPHEGVVNVAYTTAEDTDLTPMDRVSLVTTPGFDASVLELALGLITGLAIVPVSRALRDDPWALKQKYTACGVTVAFHTPSYLRVSSKTPFEGMRVLITGGEAPTYDDARDHASYLNLWNGYGPAETTLFVSLEKMSANPPADRPLTAGHPISNSRISIRRDNGTPVPPGTAGEIWLSGIGVAQGYLNNPELTARHFVDTPEGHFYRTGDLGRWTADGRLELQGRIDTQVKLHGQRIELGEIEQALQSDPAIAEAVALVAAAANETKTLHAFVRLHPGATMPSEKTWRSRLRAHLPQHMIPASVTEVASFTLNDNGKRDRNVLLTLLQTSKSQGDKVKTPPSDALERRIAAVWSELLGELVAREDNFFALGGNSLLAVTLAHRLSQDLQRAIPARDLFAAPTLAGFAQRVAETLRTGTAPASPIVASKSDLATEGQQEFWVAEAAGLDTRTFTIPLIGIVEEYLLGNWRSAWTTLVARHDSLRTSFATDSNGILHRKIAPPQNDPAPFGFASQPDKASALAYIRQCQQAPFTMTAAPLWRVGLVAVADTGEQLFWLALHHSAGDGQSLAILVEELDTLLREETLPDLAGDFAHTAAREHAYLAGPECSKDARYWDDLLTGLPDVAFEEGPLDNARSSTATPGTHRFEASLSAVTAQSLKALARAHNTSLHAVMLSLLALEARRRTGHPEVIIGMTASTRETAADARVVGYYVNMLPLPVHLLRATSFGAILDETGARVTGALTHARYPFARIYQTLRDRHALARHPARYPVFDIAVTENPPSFARHMRRRNAAYEHWETSPGEDMVLSHEILSDGRMMLQWHVNAAIYSRETADRWFSSLVGWATWLAEDLGRAKMAMPGLLPQEVALLESWEHGPRVERPSVRFHELFEHRLDLHEKNLGTHPAILTLTSKRTYAELERDANTLAHALILRGAGRGSSVGVLTERSAALPAAVLAIWKAGATYLPLSADLPPQRLAFMAKDAGLTHLIALDGLVVPAELAETASTVLRPEALKGAFQDSRPDVSGSSDDVAYIVYTSGSTGRPKGTRISHRSYINLILSTGEIYGLTPDDRSLMFASPSFDVSLSDMGLPLAFGATVCPVPYETLSSPTQFQDFLNALKITVADVTPSYLRLFDGAPLPTVRILVTGGEAPYPADVQTYAARHRYYNAYGPTENAISSTMALLSANLPAFLSAGHPLPNTSVHVCDPEGDPVPPGVIGEVWLGGIGLAEGYVGRPDLTAAAFVATPYGRRYRSGDLGRWRATGELEIIGRADDQVKLNGIRVELGEIETALRTHPDITQAVVILESDGGYDHRLWAFVLPRSGKKAPPEDSWRSYLTKRLPAYMIPATVIAVDAIPLSNSGKVDKAALKRLVDGRSSGTRDVPPQDGLEADIAQIWKELLGVQDLHRDDNFFALGGHSLLAIALAHRLEKHLGHSVPARDIFVEPTLRGFANRIGQWMPPKATRDISSDRATEGQREFWVAEHAGLDTRGFVIPLTQIARNTEDIPASAWRAAWTAVVSRHEALRTGFRVDETGILRRFVEAPVATSLEVCERADLAAALRHSQARQSEPFAMGSPPLWRAGTVRIAETGQTLFWMALHHSVGDGVSLGILTDDLAHFLQGQTPPPLKLSLDLAAGREEAYLSSPSCMNDAQYWQRTLGRLGEDSADTPFAEWPLDFLRPSGRTAQSTKGVHIFRVPLDASVAERLRNFAHKNGASLHALLLTLMALEIIRRCARPEFFLGTVASTRETADEAELVGYFVNMLPIPCRIDRDASVEETLQMVQAALAEGLQHVRYPFARMYQDFRRDHALASHPARFPLFDFAVAENLGGSGGQSGLHFESPLSEGRSYHLRANTPAQDMVLVHESLPNGSLILQWYVNAALYEKETAAAWIDSLVAWAQLLAVEDRPVDTPLPALLPTEKAQVSKWEYAVQLALTTPNFPALFVQWCALQPDRPAVVTERGPLRYIELNARANALADALKRGGVTRREPIGVFTDRSVSLPETVLAIWKAGGCYVPLATDLPADRLAFIIKDAGIRRLVVLDGRPLPAALVEAGCSVLRPEAVLPDPAQEDFSSSDLDSLDPAYVIYTSGSTGVPKGVVLAHQGLNNLGVALSSALNIETGDRVLLMASPSFDAWISDLVMAWAAGAAVVPVVRSEMDDIAGMRTKLSRLGVTVATMPPSYLRLFEQADFPGLRILMTVGEQPIAADADHYAASLHYINGYGPTENTAAATVGTVAPGSSRLTAGKPLANTEVHICDDRGNPVPPGSVGAVWLGGKGLALGYLNRPDLTATSFVETASGRLYRTGDLGRWTHTGDLQILGRSDSQVKLRGQRIELGEIEHLLAAHPGVSQSVVLVGNQTDGSQNLWGFVCLRPGADEPSRDAWHTYLAGTLPSYMLPSSIVRVPSIPVTHGGKVDQAALLELVSDQPEAIAGRQRTRPNSAIEQRIALVWSKHLERPFIAREDRFFDIGGDSLRAIAVVNQLRRTFRCAIADLYEHPRLADFAAACQYSPEHLHTLIQSATQHWKHYQSTLAAYEDERAASLAPEWRAYEMRNLAYRGIAMAERRDYQHVLLTGATGYLGSYVLRELLADKGRYVTVLVRGADDLSARARLGEVLRYYFGPRTTLQNDPRLTVLAGDLRRDDFGLSPQAYDHKANETQAIYHCAANVKHFGHYRDFHADNVAATARLLKLAAHRSTDPADFHFVSTLSTGGKALENEFHLFTEYDSVPDILDENYYVRSKQEAERLVIAARNDLANACIHRVGNVVFAADGGPLQRNIGQNAFFRQLAAFLSLGVVPNDSHTWLCHVDVVARGLVLLAETKTLANETHHLESDCRRTIASFIAEAQSIRVVGFDDFLGRLEAAIDEPNVDTALTETLENFGLYRGVSPQPQSRRLEIVSARTQTLLTQLGLVWPPLPEGGREATLRRAAQLFAQTE